MKYKDRIRSLRRVKASDLLPNPKNWRTHPNSQANALRGVLAEVGFADAVLARETDDGLMLIDGHLRAEVAPDAKLPVLVLDVTEDEADKILASHDPLPAMAGANTELLSELLDGMEFDSDATQAMLDELASEHGVLADETLPIVEDEAPEPPENPVTKPGDVWKLGRHRLVCGDSTETADVAKACDDNTPFIMVTDPPYGIEYDPAWRNEAAEKGLIKYANRRSGEVTNDDRVDWTDAYKLFTGTVAYVWHAARYADELVANLNEAKFTIRTQIIWRKPTFVISRGHYHWQHEVCWYAVCGSGSAKWCGDRSQSTVWDASNRVNNEDANNHGTQKPVEIMARPIRNHGEAGDDVYDPFLGSGTTLIAAEQLDRRCFGLEISPAYCDVIVQRWQNLTGEKASR